jgi:hypothetical protein
MVSCVTEQQEPQGEPQEVQTPVTDPAKLLRIGTMIRELLAEARRAPLDERGREQLRDIHTRSVNELKEVLSPELQGELDDLTVPFDGQAPTDSELLIAQAQIVGWLEGLFHGLQASAVAQVAASQQQRRTLPPTEQRGYL